VPYGPEIPDNTQLMQLKTELNTTKLRYFDTQNEHRKLREAQSVLSLVKKLFCLVTNETKN
jgi:hypothetical protein